MISLPHMHYNNKQNCRSQGQYAMWPASHSGQTVVITSSYCMDIDSMMTMMVFPVGTTYEHSGHLASTVCPHVGGKADPCSATSAADCADQVTRWSCVFRAGVRCKSLATFAFLWRDSNAVLLEMLHAGMTDFTPF